jgi:tRNA A37 threonylcarbamoyltransferase TsaD
MKNKLTDLRNHLFVTMESLLDPDKPMDIDRAKAVAEVAQTIINSAKVEVEYIRQIGSKNGTGFIPVLEEVKDDAAEIPARVERPLVGVVKKIGA